MSNIQPHDPEQLDNGDDGDSTAYQMQDAYDIGRLIRWLVKFDDITDGDEHVIPVSSLPGPPARLDPLLISTNPMPEEFRDTGILLSKRSLISDSMLRRMNVDQEAREATEWLSDWANALGRVKTRQHQSVLWEHGVELATRVCAHPTASCTKKARKFRTVMANKLFASNSTEEFMKRPIDERMLVYRDKFGASGTIAISDPADTDTDVMTHCIGSLSDETARSFLSKSALEFLTSKERSAWREAHRYFWRNNAFVVDAGHLHAVLNTLDANTKRTIGMLHVNIEALDDGFEHVTSHDVLQSESDGIHGHNADQIRYQNKDLRRLAQECYNLTWLRLHVYGGRLREKLQHLAKPHRDCRTSTNASHDCPHEPEYRSLCMIVQRRVEHLTWLFHESLEFKNDSISIDVERINLDGTINILDVHFDQQKLEEIGEVIYAARKKRRRDHMEEIGSRIIERKQKSSKGRAGDLVHRGYIEEMKSYIDEVMAKGGIADENFRSNFLRWKDLRSAEEAVQIESAEG